ncbi:hypothetical protein BH10PAT4_BH10PAT4_1010 [soil metagenome]
MILFSLTSNAVHAQPYGKGIYNENVPYGGQTSLTIATSGNVTIPTITPTTSGVLGTGTSTVTVTSTDVKGFKLYVRSLTSTNMDNLGATVPASANGLPNPLAVNTWGYNTDASANFVGTTLTDVLIKSLTTPASSGNVTTFTYGLKVDLAKPAGNYSTSVIYTAVPQTD